MLKTYLIAAFRNLRNNLSFSFINITGLSVAMAIGIISMVYILNEFNYDRFHEKRERIFRVIFTDESANHGTTISSVATAGIGPSLAEEVPEVEAMVRFSNPTNGFITYGNNNFHFNRMMYADSTVFDVFTFPLLEGNPSTALTEPFTAVITRSFADKIFIDRKDAIGKIITLNNRDQILITGIAADPPFTSHLKFDVLVSFASLTRDPTMHLDWDGGHNYFTYVLLHQKDQRDKAEGKLPEITEKNINYKYRQFGSIISLSLQPLNRVHLYSGFDWDMETGSSMKIIFILATITLVVLFIACINFINLTIAHSIRRMKEMGIRKVAGATRRDIISQSLSETFLIALIALFFALMLVETFHSALPQFTDNLHILEKLNFFQSSIWIILSVLTFMVLVTVFIAGFYPAFYLSKVPVVKVLKGHLALTRGKPLLRQLLIMVQFAVSATLILCTLIIVTQVDFLLRKDLGYDPSDKLVIPLMSESSSAACEGLKSAFLLVPGVTGAGASSQIPGGGFTSNGYLPKGFQEPLMINVVDVDYDYLAVMGLEPVEGRNFMKESGTDRDAFIINRSLAERLQWNDPIGKTIRRDGDHKIIGVVNDFHFSSLHNNIEPLIITLKPWKGYNYITVSVNGKADQQQLILQLENQWKEVAPHEDFQYMRLTEYIKEGYQMEMSFISILTTCAIIALLIATIGLFALAAFVSRARYREMAIRKIYGASESRIHILLSRDFLIWVFIANILAIPFAWFFMNQWLQQFAFHQGIRWWIFLATIAFSLFLASAVVFFQGLRINRLNPLDIIRYE